MLDYKSFVDILMKISFKDYFYILHNIGFFYIILDINLLLEYAYNKLNCMY